MSVWVSLVSFSSSAFVSADRVGSWVNSRTIVET